ncbi:MAG: hypothetical protein GY940_43970 [bacterium]|nr:hypothetical protein [bacterium]
MKRILWLVLPFLLMTLLACSGKGKDGPDGGSGEASETINENVQRINEEEAAQNRDGKFVETPGMDTLKSRAETIIRYFCNQAVESRATARFIVPSAPERFYLSDTLAAQLNQSAQLLSDGFDIRVETAQEPARTQYGFDEALFNVYIEAAGTDALGIELLYETKYDKFHERKSWIPD